MSEHKISVTVKLKVPTGWPSYPSEPTKCTGEALEVSINKLLQAASLSPHFKDRLDCEPTRLALCRDEIIGAKETYMPCVRADKQGNVEIESGYHRLYILQDYGFETVWIATNQSSKTILMSLV